MKQIKVEKLLDLGNQIDEVLELSVLNEIHYRAEKEGIRAIGDLEVSGQYQIYHQVKVFKELLTLDIMAPYEKIDEQLSFEVMVHHYDYRIDDTGIMMIIYLEVKGLYESNLMQVVHDGSEVESSISLNQNQEDEFLKQFKPSDVEYDAGIFEQQNSENQALDEPQLREEEASFNPHFVSHEPNDHFDAGNYEEQLPNYNLDYDGGIFEEQMNQCGENHDNSTGVFEAQMSYEMNNQEYDTGIFEEQNKRETENQEYDAGIFEEQISPSFSSLDHAHELDEIAFAEELDALLLSDFEQPEVEEEPIVSNVVHAQPKKEIIKTISKSTKTEEKIEGANELEDLFDDAKNVIINYRYVMASANDTYLTLATRYKVSEKELMLLNHNKVIANKTLIVLPFSS